MLKVRRNPVVEFSNWFDTLKEPKRFFIFMLLVFGGIVWGLIGAMIYGHVHEALSGLFFALSGWNFILFFSVAIYRLFRK